MSKLYTIGHSTHTLEAFIEIIQAYRIAHVVDVRTLPKSRHVPWFNEEALKKSLPEKNIAYTHLEKLGGLRHASSHSINMGWHNKSFRGFADYMQTPAFFEGLKALNAIIKQYTHVVIMCAEAVPWRCHRSLIADAELIRHVRVFEIFSRTSARPHKLTDFALVNRKKRPMQIYYPEPSGRENA